MWFERVVTKSVRWSVVVSEPDSTAAVVRGGLSGLDEFCWICSCLSGKGVSRVQPRFRFLM